MRIRRSGIEYDGFLRVSICGDVAVPQVTVDQRRRDGPTVRLEGPQQARYDVGEERLHEAEDVLVRALGGLLPLEKTPRGAGKVRLPRLVPAVIDGRVAVACGLEEAETTVGRRRASVQLRHPLREDVHGGESLAHGPELGEKEVKVGLVFAGAPSDGPGDQAWHHDMNGGHGAVLAGYDLASPVATDRLQHDQR